MRPWRWARRRIVVAAVAVVVIAAAGFTVVLVGTVLETREIQGEFGSKSDDRLDVSVTVTELDPTEGVLSYRLVAVPEGTYEGPDLLTSGEDIRLVIATSRDVITEDVPAGREPTAVDVAGGFTDQRIATYPFDRSVGDLLVWAVDADGASVPVNLDVEDDARLPYEVSVRADVAFGDEQDAVAVQFVVERALTARLWVVFALTLMVAVAVAGLVAAILVATGRIRLDQNIFAFYAALLFAFPILRDALPGAPSPGTLADFIAFFPAEAMAAVGLLTVLGALVFGPQQRIAA